MVWRLKCAAKTACWLAPVSSGIYRAIGVIIGVLAIVAVLSIFLVAAKNDKSVDKNAMETTLQVARLSCSSCLATIEGELRKFDGMLAMRWPWRLRADLCSAGKWLKFEQLSRVLSS